MKIRRAISSLLANYRYVFTSHGCLLYTFIECRVLSVLIFPDLYANGENVKFNRKAARGERQERQLLRAAIKEFKLRGGTT